MLKSESIKMEKKLTNTLSAIKIKAISGQLWMLKKTKVQMPSLLDLDWHGKEGSNGKSTS